MRDLWALRRRYRRYSVMEITACAQEDFQKSQSVKTVQCTIYKFRLKPYVNCCWIKAHLKMY